MLVYNRANDPYVRALRRNDRLPRQVVCCMLWAAAQAPCAGHEVGANLPTARSGLGSSKTDYSVNGIYSADVASYHTDLNLILTRIGAIDPGLGRIQTTWAASLSRQIDPRWGVVGEMSGTRHSASTFAPDAMTGLNSQAEQMTDESMVRNLDAQARAIWPQEAPLLKRIPMQSGSHR